MIYVVEHVAGGDILRTYQGLSAEVVTALCEETGNDFEFITAEDYETRLQAAA